VSLGERKATRRGCGYPSFGYEERKRWRGTVNAGSGFSGLDFLKRVVHADRLFQGGRILGFYQRWAGDFHHVENVIFGIQINDGKVQSAPSGPAKIGLLAGN
jgi:hypothetical protein